MQVIFNADDFGRSSEINAAVLRAHRDGLLTSASLMVAGDAAEQAVLLARQTPSLALGLHLVVAGGRAALPAEKIPHLVDARGFFPRNPLTAGLRYFLSATVQRELAGELRAQFERFRQAKVPLSHVDGHLDMQMHPTVFKLLLPLAAEYGAQGFRLMRDDMFLSLAYDRNFAATKIVWAVAFGLLSRWCIGRLRRSRLVFTDRVYGLMQSGRMEEAYVIKALSSLKGSSAEFYFHPSTAANGGRFGPNPGDLSSLLSPAVRRTVLRRRIRPASYGTLG